jgi:phospholipid/cholesterol/gamma-HCH transport system permease protein
MPAAATTIVPLKGDLVRTTVRRLHRDLRAIARRRDKTTVVLDFSAAGKIDSAGLAAISVLARQLQRTGRKLELAKASTEQEATLSLLPKQAVKAEALEPEPGALERLGGSVIEVGHGARGLFGLIAETFRQAFAVLTRRKRLPSGALTTQMARMGVDGIFIVGLLSFLLGMTMAFQGAVQLQRLGVGLTMVREIGPLMTAVILTGRTGAAIAAELGTMRVRSEIDALTTMGIEPVRFLILPRIFSITIVGPALSLLGMFIGMAGGMLVATLTLDLPVTMFWQRMVQRVELADFAHGIFKSLVFAWIIGFAASHLGLRAGGDASSVGNATTRTVVASIFFIIIVDALFATVTLIVKH